MAYTVYHLSVCMLYTEIHGIQMENIYYAWIEYVSVATFPILPFFQVFFNSNNECYFTFRPHPPTLQKALAD